MFRFLVVTVLTCMQGLPSSAETAGRGFTVGDMLSHCEGAITEGDNTPMHGYCLGTLHGLGYMMAINCASRMLANTFVPDGLAMHQMPPPPVAALGFIRWADRNPAEKERDFLSGLSKALSELSPCPN